MFIVPFTHKVVNQNLLKINVIKILTIGGASLWEEDNRLNIDTDILNPNGIYRNKLNIKINKLVNLYEIDTKKTIIDDFYMWEDIDMNDKETFCWRTFIYLADNNNINWLEIPDTEKLGNYLIRDLIKAIIQEK
jgi:hypothetical protein